MQAETTSPSGLPPTALRALCEAGRRPRIAMRGTSMLPLLHEPMVLELEPVKARMRVGDVLVFEEIQRLVAHRVVGFAGPDIITAGDALRGLYEIVSPDRFIGMVGHVWSSALPGARRIDGPRFRLAGKALGYKRFATVGTRRTLGRCGYIVSSANPRRRLRPAPVLFEALRGVVQGDAPALSRALSALDPLVLLEFARRHRCAAILADGIVRLGVSGTVAAPLLSGLTLDRYTASARTAALGRQTADILRILQPRGIWPVLLKGAARVYAGDPGADLHESTDIDILVSADQLPVAVEALRDAGYRESESIDSEFFRTHHHAPPLFPPGAGVSVELHHGLAPPGSLLLRTDAAHVQPLTVAIDGNAGPAAVLGPLGRALHLTIHAREPGYMRDIVLLALALQQLGETERKKLRAFVDAERSERIRMHGVLSAAADLAGVAWPVSPAARRYFDWRLRLSDMPLVLRERSEAVDLLIGSGGRAVIPALRRVLPYRDATRPSRVRRAVRFPFQVAGRALATACIAAYAPFLPKPRPS